MNSDPTRLHLNLVLLGYGAHWGAWRLPEVPDNPTTDLAHFQRLATLAEQAAFDSVFVVDIPGMLDNRTRPLECLDPTVLLAALAATTTRVGLIGTISTTYSQPYTVARTLASLDHISRGRAGWNIVTGTYPPATANHTIDPDLDHAGRYRRATEFVETCTALWDSWHDGALIADKHSGVYTDHTRLRPVHHSGEFFAVRGPLQTPPSPQRRPVLAQAGASDAGCALAARFGELVYTIQSNIDAAAGFAADIHARATATGRNPAGIRILPGLITYAADTDRAAASLRSRLDRLVDPAYALSRLAAVLNVPASTLDPDKPLPDDIPYHDPTATGQGRRATLLNLARRNRLTAGQLITHLSGGGHLTVAGTPRHIANTMHDWVTAGAADGFSLMPPAMPGQLHAFIHDVLPILHRRGLTRDHYIGHTLRDHYRLPVPDRPHAASDFQPPAPLHSASRTPDPTRPSDTKPGDST